MPTLILELAEPQMGMDLSLDAGPTLVLEISDQVLTVNTGGGGGNYQTIGLSPGMIGVQQLHRFTALTGAGLTYDLKGSDGRPDNTMLVDLSLPGKYTLTYPAGVGGYEGGTLRLEPKGTFVGGVGTSGNGLIELTSPMSVSSGRLLAYVGDALTYYDSQNPAHMQGLLGIATVAANPGEPLTIQTAPGLVTIPGWSLTPDATYFAGSSGMISTIPPAGAYFSQAIGRAKNSNTLIFSPQTSYVNAND